jgi:vacuolar protein sorting-associated protein 35
MLSELRASSLSPKNYYELYMAIFNELQNLSVYLKDTFNEPLPELPKESISKPESPSSGGDVLTSDGIPDLAVIPATTETPSTKPSISEQRHKLAELYDFVQYTNAHVIPRVYLLITIGSVFMALPNAPRQSIMSDMLDMCKGVQHPTRGLFLRYYLQQMTRSELPVAAKARSVFSFISLLAY